MNDFQDDDLVDYPTEDRLETRDAYYNQIVDEASDAQAEELPYWRA